MSNNTVELIDTYLISAGEIKIQKVTYLDGTPFAVRETFYYIEALPKYDDKGNRILADGFATADEAVAALYNMAKEKNNVWERLEILKTYGAEDYIDVIGHASGHFEILYCENDVQIVKRLTFLHKTKPIELQ